MTKLSSVHHGIRRTARLALAALVGAASLALVAPTAARADAGAAISLQRTTAIPVLTGTGINYDLFFGSLIDPQNTNPAVYKDARMVRIGDGNQRSGIRGQGSGIRMREARIRAVSSPRL